MDPLTIISAIASVVSIAQALAVGIKTLRGLASASVEFCDMLNELSSLQGLLGQLQSAVDTITQPEHFESDQAVEQLRSLQLDLHLVVNHMDETIIKLLDHESRPWRKDGKKRKISKMSWQLARGKVVALTEKARRCREKLTACLALLGFSQKLGMLMMEVRDILQVSCVELRHQVGNVVSNAQEQCLSIQSLSAHMDTRFDVLQAELAMRMPQSPASRRNQLPFAPSSGGGSAYVSSVIQVQGLLHPPCDGSCECKCHRMSTVSTPDWAQSLIGTFVFRYNGTAVFGAGDCDRATCRAQGRRSISVGYYFPSWIFGRALCISAGWDSLTHNGAWLHLTVPRVTSPPGLWRAVMHGDLAWLRDKIATKQFLPTDVEVTGESFLSHILRYRRYGVVAFLLDMGFSPTFVDASGGTAQEIAIMQLTFDTDLPHNVVKLLKRIAGKRENFLKPPAFGPGCSFDKGCLELSDDAQLQSQRQVIDAVDGFGFSLLHWAAQWGEVEKVATLIRNRATIDLELPWRKTALHLASYRGFPEVILLLLEHGANIHARDIRGYTPLHCGIKNIESVRTLLEAGANVNAKSVMGATALHLAASMSFGSHIETIYGLSVTSEGTRDLNVSEIDHAAYAFGLECPDPVDMEPNDGSGAIISELVNAGADCDLADYDGMTPLMCAVAAGNISAVRHLHRLGARLDTVAKDGLTVLDYAAIYGTSELLNCLRELHIHELDPDLPSPFGYTPVGWFERRMVSPTPWLSGQRRPTQGDVFAFCALLFEVRDRNAGTSIAESREWDSPRTRLQSWLGWQWQRLHDDPTLASLLWKQDDVGPWRATRKYSNDEAGNLGLLELASLFATDSQGDGKMLLPVLQEAETVITDAREEFFDALEY